MQKNNRKKKRYVVAVLLLMIVLSGCGSRQEEASTESMQMADDMSESQNDTVGLAAYSVYRMNKSWTKFIVKDVNIDQLETTENKIDKLVNLLISVDEETNEQVPVPNGMSYQRYTYDGTGVVTIMFNLDYDTAETYEILLCKMAFTKTLCQVKDVTSVAFEFTDLLGEKEVETTVYKADSFSEIGNDFMESAYTVTIYTPDQTGNRLDKQELSIDALSYKAPEEQIMEALCGSNLWKSPLGEDVDILDIYVLDRTCYINLSGTYLDDLQTYDDKVLVYSVVDSLTELSGVDNVIFSVEGSTELQYGENLNFTQPYTANYSMCN